MSPAEMDADLAEAASLLSCTKLSVERCVHDTVTQTSLWLFDTSRTLTIAKLRPRPHPQIGCVASFETSSGRRWETTRMSQGSPTARQTFDTLSAGCAWIVQYEPRY